MLGKPALGQVSSFQFPPFSIIIIIIIIITIVVSSTALGGPWPPLEVS
jgi:hypothetical protein